MKILKLIFSIFLFTILLNSLYGCKEEKGAIAKISFRHMSLPLTAEDKSKPMASDSVTITRKDHSVEDYTLSYEVLYRSGDMDSQGNIAGLLYNIKGEPVLLADGSQRISNFQDGNTAFRRGNDYYLLTHYEQVPGALYLTKMALGIDGRFTAEKFTNIDLSSLGGTIINCAGVKTPWDTHMASEEDYYFDAYMFDPSTAGHTAQHINYCVKDSNGMLNGDYTAPDFDKTADYRWWCFNFVKGLVTDYLMDDINNPALFTPYNYGYNFEIEVDNNGNPSVRGGTKHYTFGKSTPEQSLIMADGRTAYISDDGQYRGLYMFVADKENDLSSGTLYMAKWEQISSENGGSANLKWIKLGHGADSDLKAIINKKLLISDIFDIGDPHNCMTDNGYQQVSAGQATEHMTGPMCLKLRDGSNGTTLSDKFTDSSEVLLAAAFLETRKYGAMKGATTEFNKEEGMAYNPDKNVFYLAMAGIGKAMTGNYKKEIYDHIQLPENYCGGVYEVSLGAARDSSGELIKSNYIGLTMTAVITGRELKEGTADYDMYADEHRCHPDYISAPDNLGYVNGILFIGEDSGAHLNDMVWAYNTNDGVLTRIATSPVGGEWTGAFAMLNTERNFYIFANIQHPFADSNKTARGGKIGARLNTIYIGKELSSSMAAWGSSFEYTPTAGDYRGYVGYFFGLPNLD